MIVFEREEYDLYGIVTDFTKSSHDTYPVILGIENGDKVVIRLSYDLEVSKGTIYHIKGVGEQYKTKIHIFVNEITPLKDMNLSEKEKELIENKILGFINVDENVSMSYIMDSVEKIENKILKDITLEIVNKYKNEFMTYPAATKFHHAYKGGLIYHTYNCLRLGKAYQSLYPNINLDLVVSGIILHDIMKVKEIKGFENEYSIEGKLIGHISLIGQEIEKTAYSLGYENEEEVLLLKHIVISHHEDPEYGSPRRPQIIEALIVHLVDVSDAKLQPTIEALNKVKVGELTEQIYVNDRDKFYKHKLSK